LHCSGECEASVNEIARGVDPIGERLRPTGAGESEARRAEHGDEDLRHRASARTPVASDGLCRIAPVSGETHFRIAQDVRKIIAHYRELQEIVALLGIEELSSADGTAVKRSRRLMRFLIQPLMVTVAFTDKQGRSVELDATLEGRRTILDGEADDWAESSLYMVGDLDDARRKEAAAAKGAP
jgi:F-type H+-transporting ATPase subunit beta